MIWVVVAGGTVVALSWLALRLLRPRYRQVVFERARRKLGEQRELLEGRFLEQAAAGGKPKGLRWTSCELGEPVRFVRDRKSGEVGAFVSVSVGFAAVEGGGMEGVQAVSEQRDATAVFHYHRGTWTTAGRVLFNLGPDQAVSHFRTQYEELHG